MSSSAPSAKRKLGDEDAIAITDSSDAPAKTTNKKPKKATTVGDKIIAAIRALKSSNGSSLSAISKYLLNHFQYENPSAVKKALKREVDNGVLVKNKASYLVSGDAAYEDLSEKVEIHDVKVGKEGPEVATNDTCTIAYVGTLQETGVKFDAGKNFTFTLGNGDVIKGMESVKGMKVGGRRKLVIPASLGYGARGSSPDIPPNSVLCFDITLKALESA
jgi:FKBP-type peptidyl-prolyl cis-trans isomerase FkpA